MIYFSSLQILFPRTYKQSYNNFMSHKHKTIIKETSMKSKKIRQKNCNKNVIFLFEISKSTVSKGKKAPKYKLHNM